MYHQRKRTQTEEAYRRSAVGGGLGKLYLILRMLVQDDEEQQDDEEWTATGTQNLNILSYLIVQ